MSRDLRKEIEAVDFELKTARAELAAARELLALLPEERAAKAAELQAQLTADLAALEESTAKAGELEGERALLRHQIDEGRATVSRNHVRSPGAPEQPATSLEDVVLPAGWRKGQPWYSRLLWWVLGAKEWK